MKTPLLEPGDIFACKGRGLFGWLSRNLLKPKTDRLHWGIVWQLADNGDWVILECIGTSLIPFVPTGTTLATGRLSEYAGRDLRFYRPNVAPHVRAQAPLQLTRYGKAKYDYWLCFKLLYGYVRVFVHNLLFSHSIQKVRADELGTVIGGSDLICTKAVNVAYTLVDFPLITPGTPPTPSELAQAVKEGLLIEL